MPNLIDSLSVLIGSRTAADELLNRTTIAHLAAASLDELTLFLPEPAARRVHAAMHLGRATLSPRSGESVLMTAEAAYAHIYPFLTGLETEHLLLVCCDINARAVHTEVVAKGTTSSFGTRLGDVFAPAVRHRASAIILAHNHPKGTAKPSKADLLLTSQVLKASDLLGIEFLDHLVVANTKYTSIRLNHWTEVESL